MPTPSEPRRPIPGQTVWIDGRDQADVISVSPSGRVTTVRYAGSIEVFPIGTHRLTEHRVEYRVPEPEPLLIDGSELAIAGLIGSDRLIEDGQRRVTGEHRPRRRVRLNRAAIGTALLALAIGAVLGALAMFLVLAPHVSYDGFRGTMQVSELPTCPADGALCAGEDRTP